jgi:hypothetical protein
MSIPIAVCLVLKFVGNPWINSIIIGLVCGGAADLFILNSIKRKTMKFAKSSDGLLGEHIIELMEWSKRYNFK